MSSTDAGLTPVDIVEDIADALLDDLLAAQAKGEATKGVGTVTRRLMCGHNMGLAGRWFTGSQACEGQVRA